MKNLRKWLKIEIFFKTTKRETSRLLFLKGDLPAAIYTLKVRSGQIAHEAGLTAQRKEGRYFPTRFSGPRYLTKESLKAEGYRYKARGTQRSNALFFVLCFSVFLLDVVLDVIFVIRFVPVRPGFDVLSDKLAQILHVAGRLLPEVFERLFVEGCAVDAAPATRGADFVFVIGSQLAAGARSSSSTSSFKTCA